MKEQNSIELNEYSFSFLLSVIFHSVIFLAAGYLLNLKFEKNIINPVYVTFLKNESSSKLQEIVTPDENIEPVKKLNVETVESAHNNFLNSEYDTSVIKQVYNESTLNVSVRYPNGWVYLDQNVKNKLDGVTFWAEEGNYEIPPFIQLEVQDKYFFNPSRFKYKIKYRDNLYYYNEPEELEGYFTQIIYIRTDSNEDYSLKLMAKGEKIFKSFQPLFFSMAKSLSFGNSLF